MTEILPSRPMSQKSPTLERLLDPKRSTHTEKMLIERLQLNYSQPQRKYHTFEHVTQVFAFLDEHSDEFTKQHVANWAALYHDAVYDPTAAYGQNEIASAQMAAKNLSAIMYSTDVDRVERFIVATTDHVADPEDYDMQLFLDADMSILGSQPDEYKKYAENIRQEYNHLSNRDYAKSRSNFLISLLSSERIFITDTAFNNLEARAKRNIIAELDYLGY